MPLVPNPVGGVILDELALLKQVPELAAKLDEVHAIVSGLAAVR